MGAIKAFLSAIAEYFGWARQRSEAANAPDMKAAKIGQQEADAKTKEEKAVAEGDVDQIRKNIS